MKLWLSIILAAVISYIIAAPVRQPPEALIASIDACISELQRWRKGPLELPDSPTFHQNRDATYIHKYKTLHAKVLPPINKCLELMDTQLEYPHSDEAEYVMRNLGTINTLLNRKEVNPLSIVGFCPSFDQEPLRILALKRLAFCNDLKTYDLKYIYYRIFHRDVCDRWDMFFGLELLKAKEQCEMISNLYETKKSAEETMSESFENLWKNFLSFEQIDQFMTMYTCYRDFFKDKNSRVFRAQCQIKNNVDAPVLVSVSGSSSNLASISDDISDQILAVPEPSLNTHNEDDEPGPRSKGQQLNNGSAYIIDDSSQSISDPASNPEPISKGQCINNNLPNIVTHFNPESEPVPFAFSTIIHDSTVALKQKLEEFQHLVKTNQVIDTSELSSALQECIKVMKTIEPLLSSFPCGKNDVYDVHELKTVDGFHDFLKNAALRHFSWQYFQEILDYLPGELQQKLKAHREEGVLGLSYWNYKAACKILNATFHRKIFKDPIFIKFCITYSNLLLQKNYHKLRRSLVSMVNPNDFVFHNSKYVDLIKTYQPLLELPSADQTAREEDDGIQQDYSTRATRIFQKNFDSFLEGPMHPVEDFENFLRTNKELVHMIMLEQDSTVCAGVWKRWLHNHVSRLLDLEPKDIHMSSQGNLYARDPADKSFEFRRLYAFDDIHPSGSDLGHIQSIHSD